MCVHAWCVFAVIMFYALLQAGETLAENVREIQVIETELEELGVCVCIKAEMKDILIDA